MVVRFIAYIDLSFLNFVAPFFAGMLPALLCTERGNGLTNCFSSISVDELAYFRKLTGRDSLLHSFFLNRVLLQNYFVSVARSER